MAKGMLSVAECVEALSASGETLHASEEEDEDADMLAMGLMDVIHYLTRIDPTAHGYSGPRAAALGSSPC